MYEKSKDYKTYSILHIFLCLNSIMCVALYLNLDLAINRINQNMVFLLIGAMFMLSRLFAGYVLYDREFLQTGDTDTSDKNLHAVYKIAYVLKILFIDSAVVVNVFIYFINPNKIHIIFVSVLILLLLISRPMKKYF